MSVWKMAILAAGGVLVLSLAGCGGGSGEGDNCTPKGGASGGTAAQTVKAVADPNTVGAYDPKSLTVKAGETVEWDFQDQGAQHSVTADDDSFDSCLLSAGGKFSVTFSTPGDIKYHCTIHSQMVGDIKVS